MSHARPITAGLLLIACLSPASAAAASPTAAPDTTNTQTLRYRVLLDGSPIGLQTYTVTTHGDTRRVVSTARFTVKFFFVTVYHYHLHYTAHWRNGCLVSLHSTTNDDGKHERVDAQAGPHGFTIKTQQGQTVQHGCVRSFAYWDPHVRLHSGPLLNVQTGQYLPVHVAALGQDTTTINGHRVAATHYRLTGKKLAIDLWYQSGAQWIALQSKVDGGRTLRYERVTGNSTGG
ncbi:DUF6134 family protein [Acidihalobacter ferrooxydans]|uniref:DUF3108 domain-containing protein n=1 Tax=Acidihalobacter ferrooxydans TaxID=1765967 RepID=A0A1P8UG67_9GAMM|nr:DUF6134 family protein [Acidihalobacter ferrooxydans]APZ42847.1 hypothetical protein BW247_06855 [Acidihalobacter ferrooxydans]